VRFLAPRPAEVSLQAWQLLSIFLSTIAGLVLGPLPVGAWAFLGLTAAVAISEACIVPAMPSTTARAGGVFLPIIKSLSL
jgi:di/tricarboxylate transporter